MKINTDEITSVIKQEVQKFATEIGTLGGGMKTLPFDLRRIRLTLPQPLPGWPHPKFTYFFRRPVCPGRRIDTAAGISGGLCFGELLQGDGLLMWPVVSMTGAGR
mgnify:CR=1 FL=1